MSGTGQIDTAFKKITTMLATLLSRYFNLLFIYCHLSVKCMHACIFSYAICVWPENTFKIKFFSVHCTQGTPKGA